MSASTQKLPFDMLGVILSVAPWGTIYGLRLSCKTMLIDFDIERYLMASSVGGSTVYTLPNGLPHGNAHLLAGNHRVTLTYNKGMPLTWEWRKRFDQSEYIVKGSRESRYAYGRVGDHYTDVSLWLTRQYRMQVAAIGPREFKAQLRRGLDPVGDWIITTEVDADLQSPAVIARIEDISRAQIDNFVYHKRCSCYICRPTPPQMEDWLIAYGLSDSMAVSLPNAAEVAGVAIKNGMLLRQLDGQKRDDVCEIYLYDEHELWRIDGTRLLVGGVKSHFYLVATGESLRGEISLGAGAYLRVLWNGAAFRWRLESPVGNLDMPERNDVGVDYEPADRSRIAMSRVWYQLDVMVDKYIGHIRALLYPDHGRPSCKCAKCAREPTSFERIVLGYTVTRNTKI